MLTYEKQVDDIILNALAEDIGEGDHSTLSCIPEDAKGSAILKIKEDGILAGIDVAKRIFELKDPSAVFSNAMVDGQIIQEGEIAFEVESAMRIISEC